MRPRQAEDDEPALTEELRGLMRPRTGRLLLLLGILSLGLLVVGLAASRTMLAPLWH